MSRCRCVTIQHGHNGNKCSADATENDGLCKSCHERAANEWARTLRINVFDVSKITEAIKGSVNETHEFYKKNPLINTIVVLITILSPFLGLFIAGWSGVIIALLLSFLSYFLSPHAIVKIKEIHEK